MLDMTRTRIERSHESDILAGQTILDTGLCVQQVLDTVSGKAKARASNATNNSIFMGVSWSEYNFGSYAGGTYSLPTTFTAVAGAADSASTGYAKVILPQVGTGTADMLVVPGSNYGAATALAPVAIGSLTAGKYAISVDGTFIYVPNTFAGQTFFIAQRYLPTAQYMTLTYGDAYLPTGSQLLNRTGIITRGTVYTNNFDSAIDWSTVTDLATANVVRGGNNGRFSVNTNGCLCNGTSVVSIPSVTSPWLGLRLEL